MELNNKLIVTLKILLFIGVSIGFYFMVKKITTSFKTTCPQGTQFNTKENRCVTQCPEGQFNNPNNIDECVDCPDPTQIKDPDCGCISPCDSDHTLCGCSCMSDIDYICINKSPCYKKSVYYPSGPTGPQQCCPEGTIASSTGPIDGGKLFPSNCTSVICATGTRLCGEYCCPDSQSCCGNKCCPSGQDCDKDKNCCPKNYVRDDGSCCALYSTYSKTCCPTDDNVYVGGDGKCYYNCGDKDKPIPCEWEPGTKGQICMEKTLVDNKGNVVNSSPYCINKPACQVQSLMADPTNLKQYPEESKNSIPVCQLSSDPTIPKASCKVSNIASYNKKYSVVKDPLGSNCTDVDCGNLLADYEGIMDISTRYDANNKFERCESQVACIAAEGTKESCGNCPVFTDETKNKHSPQCCINDDGSYSGLLCEQDYICGKDSSNEFKCFDTVYSGPDTNFQCKYGFKNEINTDKNHIFGSGIPAVEVCKADKSFYRCGGDDPNNMYKLINGKCYYYNPVGGNWGCDDNGQPWRTKGGTTISWNQDYQNVGKLQLKTDYIGNCHIRSMGNTYHAEIGDLTTGIPYGLQYCVATGDCDSLSTSDRRCTQGTYYMCDKVQGCTTQDFLDKYGGSSGLGDNRQYWYTDGPVTDANHCQLPTK
jgi:hypothetical protein